MKIGDKIQCKKYLKYSTINDFIFFHKYKFYTIKQLTKSHLYIYDESSKLGLWFSFSLNRNLSLEYVWKYFYTEIEIRKIRKEKLMKLQKKLNK